MERLGSCYFCGADAQLSAYQVLPAGFDTDREVSALLCPTCRRKLATVVEMVLEAAEADAGEREPDPADEAWEAAVDAASDTGSAAEPGDAPAPIDKIEDAEVLEEPDDAELIDGPEGDEPTPPDQPAVEEVDEAEEADPLDGVSVLEYNRVMRLLQNRTFPIARAAFVEIAREAYGLSPSTVGAVLDSAVQRGLLVESAGQLAKPGEGTGGDPDQ